METNNNVPEMPSIPPKLAFKFNHCYCNALMQCIFNINEIWNEIQLLNKNDVFKIIANIFREAEKNYFGLKIYKQYEHFEPYKRITFNDLNHKEHDSFEFLMEIITHYQKPIPLLKTNNLVDPLISTSISISPTIRTETNQKIKDFQEGLNIRIKSSPKDFLSCPDVLCLRIERVDGNKLDTTPIEINKTIKFEIEDDDEIVLSETYSLDSIIINRCNCTLTLHSVSVVIKMTKYIIVTMLRYLKDCQNPVQISVLLQNPS